MVRKDMKSIKIARQIATICAICEYSAQLCLRRPHLYWSKTLPARGRESFALMGLGRSLNKRFCKRGPLCPACKIEGYAKSALLTKQRIAATHMVYWRKRKGGEEGMMTRRDGVQQKMLCVTLESLMPEEHFLRRLDGLMDFSFIYQRAESLYSHRGRPSTLWSLSRCSCSVTCTAYTKAQFAEARIRSISEADFIGNTWA